MTITPVKIIKDPFNHPSRYFCKDGMCLAGSNHVLGITKHKATGKVVERFKINCQTGEKIVLYRDKNLEWLKRSDKMYKKISFKNK